MINKTEDIQEFLDLQIYKMNKIMNKIDSKEDFDLNNLYDLIITLELFDEFIKNLIEENFDFRELKNDGFDYESFQEFNEVGTKLLDSIKEIYFKNLENKIESNNFDNTFDKFFSYTELAKHYLELESNKFFAIKNIYNELIKNNPNEIIDGYTKKEFLTYSDCQFINDIIIEFKDNYDNINIESLKERLINDSNNDNDVISKGPKDSLMYIESYFEHKNLELIN